MEIKPVDLTVKQLLTSDFYKTESVNESETPDG
jgi:hypothetical protein